MCSSDGAHWLQSPGDGRNQRILRSAFGAVMWDGGPPAAQRLALRDGGGLRTPRGLGIREMESAEGLGAGLADHRRLVERLRRRDPVISGGVTRMHEPALPLTHDMALRRAAEGEDQEPTADGNPAPRPLARHSGRESPGQGAGRAL